MPNPIPWPPSDPPAHTPALAGVPSALAAAARKGDSPIPAPHDHVHPTTGLALASHTHTGPFTICTTTTRPSSPSEGWLTYETDSDLYMFYDGSSWNIFATLAPVPFNAPTWTNLTVGNGTVETSYTVSPGRICTWRGSIDFGTTTSISGAVTVSVPLVPVSSKWFIGSARAQDASAGFQRYAGFAELNTAIWGSNVSFNFHGSANMTASLPFTWTNGDSLAWELSYFF